MKAKDDNLHNKSHTESGIYIKVLCEFILFDKQKQGQLSSDKSNN